MTQCSKSDNKQADHRDKTSQPVLCPYTSFFNSATSPPVITPHNYFHNMNRCKALWIMLSLVNIAHPQKTSMTE